MTQPITAITRADVVAQARRWLGTPWHHQARLQGVGVDCVGLVIGVARALGLVASDFDVAAYPRTPAGASLMHLVDLHLVRAPIDAPLQPGQVVVVAFDTDPQHLGIIGTYRHAGLLSIIHAAALARPGRVVETRLMFSRAMRFVGAYDLPGVTA